MSVEREMSLAEWCAKLPSLHLVNQELSTLNTQLAALAEQNGKMREALAECEQALDECRDYPVTLDLVIEALYLPDLMPSALNRIKAEAYREAADICSEKYSLSAAEEAIRARAAELEKTNG